MDDTYRLVWDICDLCDRRHGWTQDIDRRLLEQFPDYFIPRDEMSPQYQFILTRRRDVRPNPDVYYAWMRMRAEHHTECIGIMTDEDVCRRSMLCLDCWAKLPEILLRERAETEFHEYEYWVRGDDSESYTAPFPGDHGVSGSDPPGPPVLSGD